MFMILPRFSCKRAQLLFRQSPAEVPLTTRRRKPFRASFAVAALCASARLPFSAALITPPSPTTLRSASLQRTASTTTRTFVSSSSSMPSRPYVYQLPKATRPLDLSILGAELSATEEKRQQAYDAARKLQVATIQAKSYFGLEWTDQLQTELATAQQSLKDLVTATVGTQASRNPRDGNLQFRMEDYARYQAFCEFLATGQLLPPSATPYATDEEYLAGACMGLAQDLARYGMGRATVRDVESVTAAKLLVEQILEYLLQFDFRNGPLRRKYDGIKYALKSLETLLYELAVTGSSTNSDDATNDGEKPTKMRKPNEVDDNATSSLLLATEELKALRERMEKRDNLRENLIKRCRDGQKAAKQSIYALHRGDVDKAKHLLQVCQTCIQTDLLPIVQEEPPLRFGSFANLMEEYAEAKLFYAWLYGTDDDHTTAAETNNSNGPPPAVVLLQDEFTPIALEPTEYLGGLCDLTGEVGRYAVQRATLRDGNGVKLCLQTNKSILTALETLERIPREIGKKMEPLRRSVEKLERILYELSLSEAAGGRHVQTTSTMDLGPESSAAADDE